MPPPRHLHARQHPSPRMVLSRGLHVGPSAAALTAGVPGRELRICATGAAGGSCGEGDKGNAERGGAPWPVTSTLSRVTRTTAPGGRFSHCYRSILQMWVLRLRKIKDPDVACGRAGV